MDKETLDLYDKIITSCMVNTYSFSKSGKIILKDFNQNLKCYMFEFEVAKIVSSIYQDREIYIDLPFFEYLIFKFKNRNTKLKRMKKNDEANEAFNIEEMLHFVADSYDISFETFDKIYDIYWNRKELKNV